MGRPKKSNLSNITRMTKKTNPLESPIISVNETSIGSTTISTSPQFINKKPGKTTNLDKKSNSKLKDFTPAKDPLFINSDTGIQRKSNATKNLRKETESTVFPIPKICILGNVHQGNIDRFTQNAGKQCVPNSLVAIIYFQITDVQLWTSFTLDRILDLGNQYYTYLHNFSNMTHDYIFINELLENVEIENKSFHLEVSQEPQFGLIGTNNDNVGLSLYDALDICLNSHQACFVTFNKNTFAVIRNRNRYYVFDSHSRNLLGEIIPDGNTILIEYDYIMEIYNHCLNLAKSMNCKSEEQFEVTGINVHMMHIDTNKTIENEIYDHCQFIEPISEEFVMENDHISNKHLSADEDVVIAYVETNNFVFKPLRSENKKLLCQLIQLAHIDDSENDLNACPLTNPTKYVSIQGDGNCFFRSLSFYLASSEQFHYKIRLAIVRHMKSNPHIFTPFLEPYYQSIDDYIKRSKMRKSGTWSTEIEIYVAAHLFQSDIYTYSNNRWLKFPILQMSEDYIPEGIYLNHKNGNHYEIVKDVARFEVNQDIDEEKGQTLEFKRSNTKKCKRGYMWSTRKKRSRYSHEQSTKNKRFLFDKYWQSKDNYKPVIKSMRDKSNYNKRKRTEYESYIRFRLSRKTNLTEKYQTEFKPKMKTKYQTELKPKLKVRYQTELKPKLKVRYRTELKPKLKGRYQTELKPKLKEKYVKMKLMQRYMIELGNKLKAKYLKNDAFRNKAKQKSIFKFKNNIKHRVKLNESTKKRRELKKRKMSNIDTALAQFKKDSSEGPIYVCCVCNRLLFKNQVKECKEGHYGQKSKRIERLAKKCITKTYYHDCNNECSEKCSFSDNYKTLWICFTCNGKLLKGNMPAESVVNNMNPGPIPDDINCLNKLEKHLISKNIVFLKLVKVSPQNDKKIVGEAICVPSNLTKMTNVLPRCQNDDELIRVKLKKQLSNKGHYEFQTITKNNVKNALSYLISHNKHYRDVILNQDWVNEQDELDKPDVVEENKSDKPSSNDNDDSDLDEIDENIARYTCDSLGSSCLQPVDISSNILNNSDKIFSISPGENNRPVRVLMDKTNESCSFPYLFPTGKNTFSENRDVRITLGKYLKNRLMSVDTRFASCTEYLFYAQYIYELQQILSGTSIALRQGRMGGNMITADMLTRNDALQNILKSDRGYAFMKNCRGSPAFWQATQKDLFAMIRQLGTPTYFVSFSCSELRFESFLSTILQQQGSNVKVNDLNWMQKRDLLRSNPVTIARLFDQRFKLFLKKFLLSPSNPIGEVTDWFFRSEIQARGAIHIHGIVYILDSPKLDVDSDEKVVKFIDKYISCELPDEKVDPELHEIVSNVQKHSSKHSKSCRKNKKVCRFNFPKPPSNKTFICRPIEQTQSTDNDENDTEKVQLEFDNSKVNNMPNETAKTILESIWKELTSTDTNYNSLSALYEHLNIYQETFEQACEKLTNKTYVVHKRGVKDSWINQYNPHMLRAWNANLDIQYVTDAYACVVYIVSYITKAEKEMGMFLRQTYNEAKQNNLDAKACMRKISTAYLHSREVSGPESALRILGLPLKQFSRFVQFIPTGKNNVKITLPIKLLQSRAKEGTLTDSNMFMIGHVERYLSRPKKTPFDEMCIATFWSEYRLMSKSENPNVDSDKNPAFELLNDLGYVIKRSRTQPAIIRYARFSETKDPDNYYLSNLQLFLPYRVDTQFKPPGFETHEEFYKNGSIKLSADLVHVKDIVEQNRKLFQTDIDIESIQETIAKCGDMEDAWAKIAPETELDRIEHERFRQENNDEDEIDHEPQIPDIMPAKNNSNTIRSETHISGISKNDAIPLMRSLNDIQSQVFYEIRQYCLDKVNGKNPNPLKLFVTGSAGTGKSHLIKCIHYEASRILAKSSESLDEVTVLLTAPTGVSAHSINGATLHSSFSIRKGFKLPYQPLGHETINTLRCKYRNLEIVIIDEISMVDHKLLYYINGRLGQIKGTNIDELFGNVCVICFGDMWQLKPVKASSLCYENVIDFWNDKFQIVELTEIMRQRDDLAFAQVLNRIRKRKKGEQMLSSDIDMLQSRVTNREEDSLHIYSTNKQVDKYNSKIISENFPDSIHIRALDYSKDARSGTMKLKDSCVKATDTPLVDLLIIGIGTKVMLIVNLDVSAGLVNGSFGTVTYIENDQNNKPLRIYVKFDSTVRLNNPADPLPPNIEQGSIAIERHESTHINYKGDVRRQFPLRLAYAVTIHKVQGLSLDRGVVSLDKIFQSGQAYVALSRVKTLQGLTLQNFDEKVIYCDEKIESAIKAMSRFLLPERQSSPSDFNIMLFNVQGLTPHLEDIKNDKRFLKCNMICLTETWLKKNNVGNHPRVKLDGFFFHNKTRADSYDDSTYFKNLKEREHGGVGMYYKMNTNSHILNLGLLDMEYIAFNLPDKNVSVIVIYRPPRYGLGLFIPQLEKFLQELQESGHNYIVMGDFNQNILEGFCSISNCFSEFGFSQCIVDFTTEGGTIIDHVYTSRRINLSHVEVQIIPTYYSYHEAIQITLK